MTRKEEIELAWLKKAVQSNYKYDEKSFKEAVEWADKTMLEHVCECLSIYYPNIDKIGIDEFIIEFRKMIEGGAK